MPFAPVLSETVEDHMQNSDTRTHTTQKATELKSLIEESLAVMLCMMKRVVDTTQGTLWWYIIRTHAHALASPRR